MLPSKCVPARITHNPETVMNAPDPIFALESTCQRLRELLER